jgi:trimeric autotransporter adhesin
LYRNRTGSFNTATGHAALLTNKTGNDNVADGFLALNRNKGGSKNTAMGSNALYGNTLGNSNIAVGYQAGYNLTTGSNNIDIGNVGASGEANTIRIGTQGTQTATFIAGISGATVAGGVTVIVDANGQLGTIASSERFKEAIKPIGEQSEAILALKPVTFHYKPELDPEGIPQFGLVAEEVEKVNPDLVARDDQGKPYTVRYEAVNAMLLNEFLKEHRKNEKQESKIEQQEAKIARQQKQIEALTAGLQRVSAQLEASKPAPQVVNNQ